MGILVINAGSSSLKLSLFDGGKKTSRNLEGSESAELGQVVQSLCGATKIDAVGHRVVHGGTKYADSTLITDQVIEDLRQYIELDPSHEAANIKAIEQARRQLPDVPHVAVFDTAYHHNMPLTSQVYPGPYSWYADLGIRRFGFHGINHQYCARRVKELPEGREASCIISCHLGSGSSLCASLNGQSVMTTMGYTPLEGLVMSSRSGSLDPGIILVLLKHGYTADQLNVLLNRESGLKGISGLSGDMREIERAMADNERAALAFAIHQQTLAASIAGLVPVLGHLDALIFSGGIGEHSPLVRESVCARLSFLGVAIDPSKNSPSKDSNEDGADRDISLPTARVKTFVIAAGEDLSIARECEKFCAGPAELNIS